jgi:ATP-dependent Clp protease ATP-binding subunit ClpA
VLVTPNKARGNVVMKLLDKLQISPIELHSRVLRSMPRRYHLPTVHPRISACTERVLQRAEEEAARLKSESVAPEHLLFGIVREGTSGAAQLLIGVGANLETIPQKMEQLTA